MAATLSFARARPLLAGKVIIPPRRPGGVVRPRLQQLLRDNASTRLTVVVAPAGWGKSTLLSEWAHDPAEHRPIGWVSLDESDDEPARFWAYVLTALQGLGLGGEASAVLRAGGADPMDVAVPTLLNELESSDARAVLVLDDYHLLADPRVHEGVEFLLAYLPAALRLVVSGRADPPLPLPRLRARGELTEIRAGDLTFSPAEARALVSAVAAVDLDTPSVDALCERTEGWAAGLQLAALALRGAPAPTAPAAVLRGGDRHVVDYVTAEVLDQLPQDHRDLLVGASVLDQLCGPLCDAALERSGSAEVLAELDRAHLFVVPVDARGWFRCHRLVRDALRSGLEPSLAAAVLQRAADWFLAEGHVDDAVRHRIDAGDDGGAAAILRSSVPWFLEHGELPGHLRLGDRLDPAVARADARFCLAQAWAAGLSGQCSRMGPWLDAADVLIADTPGPPLDGWHTARGAAAAMRAVQREAEAATGPALACAELAVELEVERTCPGYLYSRLVLGSALLMVERAPDAVPLLEDARDCAQELRLPPLLALQPAGDLALALLVTGRLVEARQLCTETAPVVRQVERGRGEEAVPGAARLHLVEGRLALRSGDVAGARRLLRRAVAGPRSWGWPSLLVMALTSLAEAELAGREPTAAREAVARATGLAAAEPVWPFVRRELEDVAARVAAGRRSASRRPGAPVEELTDRELSVLRMLTGTANQREIGAALFLSINTVKGHAKSLYRKLDVPTRQDAVDRGRELGLI